MELQNLVTQVWHRINANQLVAQQGHLPQSDLNIFQLN